MSREGEGVAVLCGFCVLLLKCALRPDSDQGRCKARGARHARARRGDARAGSSRCLSSNQMVAP